MVQPRISVRAVRGRITFALHLALDLVGVGLHLTFANTLQEQGHGGFAALMATSTLLRFVLHACMPPRPRHHATTRWREPEFVSS